MAKKESLEMTKDEREEIERLEALANVHANIVKKNREFPRIRTQYHRGFKVPTIFDPEEKRTKSSHKDECDINKVMEKYVKTGQMPAGLRRPRFEDFQFEGGLKEMLERYQYAEADFLSLPSKIRTRFDNDPVKFVEFFQQPMNAQEAYDLGFLTEPPPQPGQGGKKGEKTPPGDTPTGEKS